MTEEEIPRPSTGFEYGRDETQYSRKISLRIAGNIVFTSNTS
jgi:hypothetical protein